MENNHKKLLRECTEIMVRDLNLDAIFPLLMASKVFSEAMVESIKNAGAYHQQKFKFILDIQKRGPKAFYNFIEALLTTQQYNLASKLKPDSAFVTTTNMNTKLKSNNNGCLTNANLDNRNGILDILMKQTQVIYSGPGIYEMSLKWKGLALIINNEHFILETNLAQRKGTSYDCVNLQSLLAKLGYKIVIKCDLTKEQMKDSLYDFSNRSDHSNSTIVSILSHGTNDKIFGIDGQLLSLDYIASLFDGKVCQNLHGKPKIFILQACRGDERDKGFLHVSATQNSGDSTDSKIIIDDSKVNPIKYPTGMDMLFAYATLPGYVSWRNDYLGTWFIRSLVHVFSLCAHENDILTMLTKVNDVIITNYESKSGHKMLCEFTSRLSKTFYFNPL